MKIKLDVLNFDLGQKIAVLDSKEKILLSHHSFSGAKINSGTRRNALSRVREKLNWINSVSLLIRELRKVGVNTVDLPENVIEFLSAEERKPDTNTKETL